MLLAVREEHGQVVDVDEEVVELRRGAVGVEPIGNAWTVGLGHAQHGRNVTGQVDKQRWSRRFERECRGDHGGPRAALGGPTECDHVSSPGVLNESTGRSRITHDTGGVPMAHCGDKLGLLCPAFSR